VTVWCERDLQQQQQHQHQVADDDDGNAFVSQTSCGAVPSRAVGCVDR